MTNKVALITGDSRGIGKAMVQRFKKDAWTVATCATSENSLKGSQADLNLVCDVSDVNQVKKNN